MKYWPVPNSNSKEIPKENTPGSFWENRKDRYHCGIDIYAPCGSEILSVEDGAVIEKGVFTSAEINSYWFTTYYILIQNNTNFICKYAELRDVTVNTGESVKAGQLIGRVGSVINKDMINGKAPSYIQEINKKKNYSMLHFEIYTQRPSQDVNYLGGNWFESNKPEYLLDPTDYLRSTK